MLAFICDSMLVCWGVLTPRCRAFLLELRIVSKATELISCIPLMLP